MEIENLAHILRASKAITGETTFVLIGSQAILAQFPDPPEQLKISMEIDLWPKFKPDMADMIEDALGADSVFHGTFGYFADGVGPETAILPENWESRSIKIENNPLLEGAIGICPEIHDICASKLMAFRDKDIHWVSKAVLSGLAEPQTILERLEEIPERLHPEKRPIVISWLEAQNWDLYRCEADDGPQ